MKKDFVLKLIKKIKNRNIINNDILFLFEEDEDNLEIIMEIVGDENLTISNIEKNEIFLNIIKNIKLKEFVNISTIKEIKKEYLDILIEYLYETRNTKDCGFYTREIIFNKSKEKINIEKLDNQKKLILLDQIIINNDISSLFFSFKSDLNPDFLKLLLNNTKFDNEIIYDSILLKNNLELTKKILNNNWSEEDLVKHLEDKNYDKLCDLVKYNWNFYKYVSAEKNKKDLFEKFIKNKIEKSINEGFILKGLKNKFYEELLKPLLIKQIEENKTDYIALFSIKAQSFIVRQMFNRKNEFNSEEYLILLSTIINFDQLEDIELAKEYVSFKKNVRDF